MQTANPAPLNEAPAPSTERRRLDRFRGGPEGDLWPLGTTAAVGLATLLIFLQVRNTLADDAYITLAYARNVATDLHWGMTAEQVSNTATSPLNIILLSLCAFATRITGSVHAVAGLGMLSVGLAMTQAWAWTRVVRALDLPRATMVLAPLLVLVNPFVISTLGLEVLLIPALLTLLLAMAVEGRPAWFGVLAGLTMLVRLDLIVFVLLMAAVTPAIRQGWRKVLLGAVLAAGPWYLFSWFYFGSAIPDTLVIKTSQHAWGKFGYFNGPALYYSRWPATTVLAFLPALLGLFSAGVWVVLRTGIRWSGAAAETMRALLPAAALGFGGALYFMIYTFLGVGPYHWYYVPPMAALSLFLAVAVGAWLGQARAHERLSATPALAAGALVLVIALGSLVINVGHGLAWKSAVINTNWATASDYARVAKEVKARVGDAAVMSPGEIGTLAYHGDLYVIDVFSDRGRADQAVKKKIAESGPLGKALYKLNYLWRDEVAPAKPAYRLVYAPGPATGPNAWTVHSPWRGTGHFTLVPLKPTP